MGDRRSLGPESFGVILDCVADGVFTVDRSWSITFFNAAAERITGVTKQRAVGQRCSVILGADICDGHCVLRQSIVTGRSVVGRLVKITRADGRIVPVSVSTALLRDQSGEVIGGVETIRDLTRVEELRRRLLRRHRFGHIVTQSRKMIELLDTLPQVAPTDATCLIMGESGTGKELLARAIHRASEGAQGPFVAVNCGALPDTLLESELFGHVAGAFTDAKKERPGRFAAAEGGTLFLDEIGDVSQALQVRLLRVLQEKEYQKLGSDVAIPTDVRVIAATNKDLDTMVESGEFRADLYYRLNVVALTLPPLRERGEDIPLLCDHFISRLSRKQGKDISGLSTEVFALFMGHRWPGNVRELENAIEHAFILCSGGLIQAEHLPAHLRPSVHAVRHAPGCTLAEIEARAILEALRRNKGHRGRTARELGISTTTLWRRLRQLGEDDVVSE